MKQMHARYKQLKHKQLGLVGIVASAFVIQAAFAETSITETLVTPARQNELLYFVKHDCGSCHGITLKGGLGPALLPETLAAKPKEYLVTTILEGREDTAMPPWKTMFSRNEAEWITEQLQSGTMLPTALAKEQSSSKQLPAGQP